MSRLHHRQVRRSASCLDAPTAISSSRRARGRIFCYVAAMLIAMTLLLAPKAHATDDTWTGGTSTTWSTSGNWSPSGPPGSTDNAKFTGTFTSGRQPTLTASATVGGLWMTGTLGQNVTISGAFTLSLAGNTINGTPGLGILMDNTDARTLTISSNVALLAAQTWKNSSANLLTVSGTVNNAGFALTLANTSTGGMTLSNVISGGGAVTINNSGAGVTTFSNTGSTYSGQLTVQSGTLSIDTANNISSNGELGNNALAVILGGSGTTGTLEWTGGSNSTTTKTFTMATGGTGVFQIDGSRLTINAAIGGSGALTKTGAGTLALQSTSNSWAGDTTINAGFLRNAASDVIPNGAGKGNVIVNASGTWELRSFNETINGLSGSGSVIADNGNSTTTLTLGDNNATSTFSGNISQGGNNNPDLALTKIGTGTQILSGTNSYTSVTTVSAGTLQFGKQVSLYNNTTASWTATNIVVASGATAAFNVGGTGEFTSANIDTLKALGTASGGFKSGSFLGLDTTNASGGNFTYGSVIANPNGGANVLGLTKLGTNTLTLTGANTYTGATTVNGGSLFVNGNQSAATGTVTVNNSGTTLGGSGTIGGAVNVASSGANLSPGATGVGSVGKLNIGNVTTGALTLAASSNFKVDITGAGGAGNAGITYDQANVTGTVNITNSILQLTVSGLTATNIGQKYFIVANDLVDAVTGTFSGQANLSTITVGADVFLINYGDDTAGGLMGNDISLTLTAVPEPSTWFAAALAMGAIGFSQRKRVRVYARPKRDGPK